MGRKSEDLTGRRFGHWIVKKRVDKNNVIYWLCECEHGIQKTFNTNTLLNDKYIKHCEIEKENIKKQKQEEKEQNKINRSKRYDLTGQKFGHWTVIRKIKNRRGYWLCECDCENKTKKEIYIDSLKKGNNLHCGCISNKYNIIGKKFGKWTVLKYIKHEIFKCQCECGNINNIPGINLIQGKSTQCRKCQHKSLMKININIGDKFGELTAISNIYKKQYKNNLIPVVLCKCSCGTEDEIIIYNLIYHNNQKCHKCASKENGIKGANIKSENAKSNLNYIEHEDYYELIINNNSILFDKIDYEWIKKYTWRINNRYVCTGHSGENFLKMHNKIMENIIGQSLDEEIFVDHINRNKLDNRRNNLNISNKYGNNQNRGLFKNNKSGVKGVCFIKFMNKWNANIGHEGKSINLGYFDDFNEAVKIRLKAENNLWDYIKNLKDKNLYIDENNYYKGDEDNI